MFFLIPWNTDAPLYHRPVGTVVLILLNVLAFAATTAEPRLFESMALDYGRGFTPVQWFTSNFVHGNLLHLLGNMLFLWGFGLIVEGKLGWRVFVPLYLAIGATECALEQAIYWNSQGGSLGASAIIFGLMAICLIWAPRNEVQVFYVAVIFWIYAGIADLSVIFFSLLHLAMSVFFYLLSQFWGGDSADLLHLLGAVIGALAGVLMLRRGWVDCEGWDLFSVMSGNLPASHESVMSADFQEDLRRRRIKKKSQKASRTPSANGQDPGVNQYPAAPGGEAGSPEKFSQLMGQGKSHAAHAELVRIRHYRPDWKPTDQELLDLSRGLRKAREYEPAIRVYEELLALRPHFALGRIELATLLALTMQQPAAARRWLEGCEEQQLTPAQRKLFQQLREKISALLDSGIVEIDRRDA